jgi:hypothetical protein
MINAPQLLLDLKRRLTVLEADLLARISEVPSLEAALHSEWQTARDANRTAETFESWVDQVITQAGVHWLLSCVFLRFIEDNGLVERPWIGGTTDSGRLNLARDRHEAYFRAHPAQSDREYLLACFMEAGELPGLHTFFDAAHNPVFRLGISGDAAMGLRQFWQQQDPNTGALVHDFTDATWNTRFLGDLYQDLSEATRKRYALLQTPEFVEEFILDRTLTPALREFGYRETRMIDPTCGSGHFLLGGFTRMVNQWLQAEPTRNRRDVAQKALDAVCGVDLNPFAVAISRFRLLLAALHASGVHRLSEAPDFHVNVVIGDSLLHGTRFGMKETADMFQRAEDFVDTGLSHAYASEDLADVQRILGRQYHAVVGNPPYIVVKDAALNAAYRSRYASCHMKYSLGAPFTERFFELTLTGSDDKAAGFVGLITANSFMKREFGSKLIEKVLPRLDLTHVIDTAGAYIPGHGTPTVILFGRHRAPVGNDVRTVMGIKGEPATPVDPAKGLVWSSILSQIDRPGSESVFVSVAETARTIFANHPWSIGGGGASDLKVSLEAERTTLKARGLSIGFACITGEDEVFVLPANMASRFGFPKRAFGSGDEVRDWDHSGENFVVFPYQLDGARFKRIKPLASSWLSRHFWRNRTNLRNRLMFGKTPEMAGMAWWDLSFKSSERLSSDFIITFAEVATHNHFVLDRGAKVFKQTAPVIKLPAGAKESEYLELLGLLNSSVACFWLKQVCHNKGSTVDQHGARQRTSPFEDFYAFNSTKVGEFPVIDEHPLDAVKKLESHLLQLEKLAPEMQISPGELKDGSLPTRVTLDESRTRTANVRRLLICDQEELDWRYYRLYGLLDGANTTSDFESNETVEVALGERAFEIVLARRIAAGTEQTTWFERHGSTPTTEIPSRWPATYQRVVQRRIDLIEQDQNIRLIERPEYKRRWNSPSWESLEHAALRAWLLARLELPRYWATNANQPPSLTSTSRLADATRQDSEFIRMAALYAGHTDFDHSQLVVELVAGEAAPFLPVLRYAGTGLRKHAQWQSTWDLQRREDAIDAQVEATAQTKRQQLMGNVSTDGAAPDAQAIAWVDATLLAELTQEKVDRKRAEIGSIPVPPKYQAKDFLKSDFWRLRGGLDVPKERWISYPGCERGADGSLVIAWAGWDHLQQATALASYYLDMKDSEGWAPERLQLLLAGLLDLLPWLEQWHNDVDPVYGARMGDYYRGFVEEEARTLGFTLADLRNWEPPKVTAKRGRKAKA